MLACQQPPSEGSKTNSVSEASRESKNSASEADGGGGGGSAVGGGRTDVDIVFDARSAPW